VAVVVVKALPAAMMATSAALMAAVVHVKTMGLPDATSIDLPA
jgi:hypothetical protein